MVLALPAKAFSVSAPSVWNSLSYNCRCCDLLSTFKRSLKTELFDIAIVDVNTQPSLCHYAVPLIRWRHMALCKCVLIDWLIEWAKCWQVRQYDGPTFLRAAPTFCGTSTAFTRQRFRSSIMIRRWWRHARAASCPDGFSHRTSTRISGARTRTCKPDPNSCHMAHGM